MPSKINTKWWWRRGVDGWGLAHLCPPLNPPLASWGHPWLSQVTWKWVEWWGYTIMLKAGGVWRHRCQIQRKAAHPSAQQLMLVTSQRQTPQALDTIASIDKWRTGRQEIEAHFYIIMFSEDFDKVYGTSSMFYENLASHAYLTLPIRIRHAYIVHQNCVCVNGVLMHN